MFPIQNDGLFFSHCKHPECHDKCPYLPLVMCFRFYCRTEITRILFVLSLHLHLHLHLSLSPLCIFLSLSLSQFRSNSTKFVFHLVYQSIKSLYRKCGNLSVLIVVLSKLEFTKLTTQKKICNIYSLLSLPRPNWNFCIILWAMKCLGWTLSVNRAMHLELCVTRNWQLELFLRFHFSYLFIYFRPSVIRKIY